MVECAVVYPLVFILVLGLVVGGLGIFRYQETASLAREAARWASVHGDMYAKEVGVTTPTAADIYNTVILPRAVGMDTTQLNYSITWDTGTNPYHAVIVNGDIVPINNVVTVRVSYRWIPEYFLGGLTLSSTSVMPMSY